MKKLVGIVVCSLILIFIPGYGGSLAKKVEGLRFRDAKATGMSQIREEPGQKCESWPGCSGESGINGCCVETTQEIVTEIISTKDIEELKNNFKSAMVDAEDVTELSTNTEYTISGTKNKNIYRVTIKEDNIDGNDCRVITISVVPSEMKNL